ncbi:MAG: hypothetical protein M1812_005780 [Candelaria pacifica]|nr:MAG: hypothetical protein M1812_005780 [Candelaria pacifica]
MSSPEGSLESDASTRPDSNAVDSAIELADLSALPASQSNNASPAERDARGPIPPAEESRMILYSRPNAFSPPASAPPQASNDIPTEAPTSPTQSPDLSPASSLGPPHLAPQSSRWNRMKRRVISKPLESILTLMLALGGWLTAIVALLPSFTGKDLAEWTAAKDFREQCRQDKASNISTSDCESALKKVLPYPPHVSKDVFEAAEKRWIKFVSCRVKCGGGYSTTQDSFSEALKIFTIFATIFVVLRSPNWRRILRRWKFRVSFSKNSRVKKEDTESLLLSFPATSSWDYRSTVTSVEMSSPSPGTATLRNRKEARRAQTNHPLVKGVGAEDRRKIQRPPSDRSFTAEAILEAVAGNGFFDTVERHLTMLDVGGPYGEKCNLIMNRVVDATLKKRFFIERLLDLDGDDKRVQELSSQCLLLDITVKLGGNDVLYRSLKLDTLKAYWRAIGMPSVFDKRLVRSRQMSI